MLTPTSHFQYASRKVSVFGQSFAIVFGLRTEDGGNHMRMHPLWSCPFGRVRVQELKIPEQEVENLLVSLILDNRVHGHIDQVNQLLELGEQ